MMPLSIHSNSPEETLKFGRRFGRHLLPGTVVALTGGLGSGKTTLIQSFAKGLGVKKGEVKSPTFVLFHIYKGKYPVYHFDLYRLSDTSELEAIGFDEFIADPSAVSFVEWAERAAAFLPKDFLQVKLKDEGETVRRFWIRGSGPKSRKMIQAFCDDQHSRH